MPSEWQALFPSALVPPTALRSPAQSLTLGLAVVFIALWAVLSQPGHQVP